MLRRLIEVLTETRVGGLKQGFEKIESLVKIVINKNTPKILDWVTDLEYIMYLGFMKMNKPEYLKVH